MANLQSDTVRHHVQMELPLTNLRSFNEVAGSFRRKEAVQEALRCTRKNCQLKCEKIAQEMTRLTGENITVSHINNWTAESKSGWKFPLEYAASWFVVTGDAGPIRAALSGSGIDILNDKERAYLELGKIVAEDKKRGKKKRQVMEALGL